MQMAEDLRHPGHLLMAENHCLKTLNLANQQTSLVVGNSYIAGYREGSGGSARFNILSGFEQINSSHVLITDVYNHCIRLLDRSTNTTTTIAGVCGWSGHRDGPLTSARLNTPFKIIRLPNTDRYLISDYGNLLIRELNLATGQVSTFVNTTEKPNALLLSRDGSSVFFSWFKGIGEVNLLTKQVTFLTSPDKKYYGFRDGPASRAVFHRVEEMVYLNDNLILMTDLRNNVLRLFNIRNKYVTTICNTGNSTVSGTIETCQMRVPRSLLVQPSRNRVLIGCVEYIGYLNIRGRLSYNHNVIKQ